MKFGLSVREAGWLLGKSESQIRRLLASDRLDYAVRPHRVTAASVRALLPADDFADLRQRALTLILQGWITAPAAPTRYAKPAPITDLVELTRAQAAPAFDTGRRSVRSRSR